MSPFEVIAPAHSRWPINVASAQSAPASQLTKPEFLARAEKNYDDAKAALRAEESVLEQLRQEEAKLRQAALAKTGSWIEPTEWWRKKQAIKQSMSLKRDEVRRAKSRLMIAENRAHAAIESGGSKRHKPFWWQW
jgi:multidrug resistance efflux pump